MVIATIAVAKKLFVFKKKKKKKKKIIDKNSKLENFSALNLFSKL